MKWLLVALLLLLLFPLIASRKNFGLPRPAKVETNQHDEVRPEFWHSEHPIEAVVNFVWCRPQMYYSGEEVPRIFKHVRNALLEQTKWITALIRDAVKPSDEKVLVEMVVLADGEKYRDWDPVWIRKTVLPDTSVIRIFLNEAFDSEISEFCRQERLPSVDFAYNISIGQYFAKPALICKLGLPTCDVGRSIVIVPIFFTVTLFATIYSCASCWRKMMDDVNQTTTDRSHGYSKERQGYQDLFMEKKDVQTRRSSWPDDEDIPDEFRIIPEPEGPYDDPVPIDPITEAENARVRKPLERTWNTGVYYC